MKIWQILMVSAAAGVTLPALAKMAEGPVTRAVVEASVRERLGKLDTSRDGTVTRDEIMTTVSARMEARAGEAFAAMDADKNGSISRAEFDAFHAKRGERRFAHMDRIGGPDGMMPPPPGLEGAPPPPPPGADGKPAFRERPRVMIGGRDGMIMGHGDGKGIVIADAVKKALERFDATDTNKDGTISPEERKARRDGWRMRVS